MVGKSVRQSPEADVPVLQDYEITAKLGGAANVALSCQQLGADVSLVSLIGDDDAGRELVDLLSTTDVDAHMIIDADRPTTVKTRVLCNDEHLLRIDRESTDDIRDVTSLMSRLSDLEAQRHIDVLILQDYNKGVLVPESIDAILAFAKSHSISTAVDPKLRFIDNYKGVDLFKPNRREAEAIVGRPIVSIDAAKEAATYIMQLLSAQTVLLTLGADGVVYTDASASTHAPASQDKVVDVCGAGDAVLATCAMAMVHADKRSALPHLAVRAGAIACSVTGVTPIRLQDF
jgi:rfaE bifunctional protein kinase chain/domain